MKLERKTMTQTILTQEERDAFEIVDKVLLDWQRAFFPQIQFHSIDTGEIFQIEELSRVRGILALLGTDTVFIKDK